MDKKWSNYVKMYIMDVVSNGSRIPATRGELYMFEFWTQEPHGGYPFKCQRLIFSARNWFSIPTKNIQDFLFCKVD